MADSSGENQNVVHTVEELNSRPVQAIVERFVV